MERKVFASAKADFTDEKTGVEFRKDRTLQGVFDAEVEPSVVRFPPGAIHVSEVIVPLSNLNERLDLLYLTDEQILEKLMPKEDPKE